MKPYESSWKVADELDPRTVRGQADELPLSIAIMIGVQLLVAALLIIVTVVMG